MLDGVTDRDTECKQEDLRDYKERSSEDNVADGPTVFEGAEDKNELRDDVYGCTDERPEDVDDPETNGFGILEAGELFECGDGNKERNAKKDEAS